MKRINTLVKFVRSPTIRLKGVVFDYDDNEDIHTRIQRIASISDIRYFKLRRSGNNLVIQRPDSIMNGLVIEGVNSFLFTRPCQEHKFELKSADNVPLLVHVRFLYHDSDELSELSERDIVEVSGQRLIEIPVQFKRTSYCHQHVRSGIKYLGAITDTVSLWEDVSVSYNPTEKE